MYSTSNRYKMARGPHLLEFSAHSIKEPFCDDLDHCMQMPIIHPHVASYFLRVFRQPSYFAPLLLVLPPPFLVPHISAERHAGVEHPKGKNAH